mmetsp:Transcript_87309/g.279992  ORF Transcript_87309/g.279992 Transcript_87309/m.279992 type:complete len:207 (+) Transcript_87309:340-960(+)
MHRSIVDLAGLWIARHGLVLGPCVEQRAPLHFAGQREERPALAAAQQQLPERRRQGIHVQRAARAGGANEQRGVAAKRIPSTRSVKGQALPEVSDEVPGHVKVLQETIAIPNKTPIHEVQVARRAPADDLVHPGGKSGVHTRLPEARPLLPCVGRASSQRHLHVPAHRAHTLPIPSPLEDSGGVVCNNDRAPFRQIFLRELLCRQT